MISSHPIGASKFHIYTIEECQLLVRMPQAAFKLHLITACLLSVTRSYLQSFLPFCLHTDSEQTTVNCQNFSQIRAAVRSTDEKTLNFLPSCPKILML